MKKTVILTLLMLQCVFYVNALPKSETNTSMGDHHALNISGSSTSGQNSSSTLVHRGERPPIDLNKVSNTDLEPTVIRIKFSSESREHLKPLNATAKTGEIVKFGIPTIDVLNQQFGVYQIKHTFDAALKTTKFTERHRLWGFDLWYDLIVPEGTNIKNMVLAYAAENEIEVSEPVYKKQHHSKIAAVPPKTLTKEGKTTQSFTPNDPQYNAQWHYHNTGQQSGTTDSDIDLPEAWEIETGHSDVIVAVIDEGIDYLHPDLAGNMWPGIGYNFAQNTTTVTPMDHGSHVGGTVAANTNNGIGISGVAGGSGTGNGIRLMSCQVYTSTVWGGWEAAPIWAADHDAAISQNSWGYNAPNVYEQAMLDAIDYFNANGGGTVLNGGGITIFSAGNSNGNAMYYPGCYPGVVAVAATNNQDLKTWYSNYANWVDISAPGGETNTVQQKGVLSCLAGNGYGFKQGTSMACPHVSGVAALIISLSPGFFTPEQVIDILTSTTDDINGLNPVYMNYLGTGRLNAHKALLLAQEHVIPIARFTANTTLICTGGSVSFTDNTLTTPTSWLWNFPGGTPSSYNGQTPPPIVYQTPGIYDVSLTVSNGITPNTLTKTSYIAVKNVIANFTVSSATVNLGSSVIFSDASTCGPTTWEWSFPGGTPSSYFGPTPPPVVYATLGTYSATLTVSKSGSFDTKSISINVVPVVFNMSNSNISSCTGQFYDSGGPSGNYSNVQNLTQTFYPSTSGAMVRLTFSSFSTEDGFDYLKVYNGTSTSAPLIGSYTGTNSPGVVSANNTSGALTFRFTSDGSYVSTGWAASISCYVITDPPLADFAASATTSPMNIPTVFTDLSINVPTNWLWSFSPDNVIFVDGTNASSQNPHILFTAEGIYTVSLIASNAYGTDTEIKTDFIVVGPAEFNMKYGTETTCSGTFYDSGGPLGNYSFNENYIYTFVPGELNNKLIFNFTLFELEFEGDTLTIFDGPDVTATLVGKYTGNNNPGMLMATHPSGALSFKFTSSDWGGGATGSANGWAASISCYNPTAPPVAGFTVSETTAQQNSILIFTDQSLNMPTSWLWSFSPTDVAYVNGTDETSQNPQVEFLSAAQYTVTLLATNANGSDTETRTNFITISPPNYCVPIYTYGALDGDYISLVDLEDINNPTGASESPFYTYYNTLSANLARGSEYTITLVAGTMDDMNNLAVWIDFNKNGNFDAEEQLGMIELLAMPDAGSIVFTVPTDAMLGTTRMRVREVWAEEEIDPCTSYFYGETEDYNVTIINSGKNLSLKVYLEGLFNGNSMNKAQNSSGNQFAGSVADQITVALHSSTFPHNIVEGPYIVDLNVNGLASVALPESLTGEYYIVVQHRNSIETWSSIPVSFNSGSVSYDFTDHFTQAYGDNLKYVSGFYVLYAGDVNQDGFIDNLDMTLVKDDADFFNIGYISKDINGDGTIDALDLIVVDNNASNFSQSARP